MSPISDALPLDLLPPLEPSHQLATPNPPGGEQRSVLLLDDTAGKELDPLPSRLLIGKDGQTRSIWPVHLAGWQALGWQLLSAAPPVGPEPAGPEPAGPEPAEPDPPAAEPVPTELEELLEALVEVPPAPDPVAGEALLAEQAPDFQAMTKAEIVAFCSATYGVSLDGGMTKAELVEQANALHASTQDTTGGGTIDSDATGGTGTPLLELPDGLL
ncbi:MAG: hypothetical protein ACNA8O_14405 [Cyanobacteriota bacterium]